jgi:hypothetical protein
MIAMRASYEIGDGPFIRSKKNWTGWKWLGARRRPDDAA